MSRLSKIGAAALAAFGWTSGTSGVTATYLVVAGGGSGGVGNASGGGGAGGYRTSAGSSGGGGSAEATISLNILNTYTVVVGAGGAATSSGKTSGSDSSISGTGLTTITSTGGGSGGSNSNQAGTAGGSGGGGGNTNSSSTAAGGAGTANQGYAGGSVPINGSGAGGGGAGAVGGTAYSAAVPNNPVGGVGVASSITGTSTYYGGGGGGGTASGTNTGGNGGGGNGGTSSVSPASGTASTGGGGGGLAGSGSASGSGGSGVVIISYVGAQQFSGGVVTSVGGSTIHTFNTSGTLGVITPLTAASLVVAGGGGGSATFGGGYGGGGGGGAGGYLTGSGITIDPNTIYVVTVGAAGVGGVTAGDNGTSGGNSVFLSNTSIGGGRGASFNTAAASGGSGGGKGYGASSTFGTGTAGQGNNGGSGTTGGAGGGGGASAVGGNGTDAGSGTFPQTGGAGGSGSSSSISGTAVTYAGGGGGGGYANSGGGVNGGAGGSGGGGAGGGAAVAGTAGTANLGGGGGAGGGANLGTFYAGANGGSGVVIISYPGATQQMAGGIVTISGGNVIHTFNTSGYLTPITYYTKSLRFRASASASLTRTPPSGNRQTWTWSSWVKRGQLGLGSQASFFTTWNANNQYNDIGYNVNDVFHFFNNTSGAVTALYTTAVYRDTAAWYHVILAVDTTQATASDRVKIYINGVQITSFGTETYPAQNSSLQINSAIQHNIGYGQDGGGYFDGEMAAINFVDGQALAPTSFGTFNSYNQWQPITYGGSYGTNGFYLPFNSLVSNSYAGSFAATSALSVPNSSALYLGGGSFAIECWIYPTASGGSYGIAGDWTTGANPGPSNWILAIDGPYINFYAVSSGNYYDVGGVNLQASGWTNVNVWHHIAVTYDGTTLRLFVNGAVNASSAFSGLSTNAGSHSSTIYIASIVPGTAYFFPGYISNFRIVKGSAVYTTTFTPSTVPLLPITGTALLTLQNSTFIDNSINKIAITNINSATTSLQTPFGTPKVVDSSPNGNNWTPNNISLTAGSTYDLLTDVPTLTSNTAANYAVLNAVNPKGNSTVSNGNLTEVITTVTGAGRGTTIAVTSGKFYVEATATGGGAMVTQVGVTSPSASSYQLYSTGVGYYSNSGNKYISGVASAYGTAWSTAGTYVIGMALDVSAGTIQFYLNNVAQGNITLPATPSDGWIFVADWESSGGSVTYNWNYGQQPFTYTAPSGFLPLNTYNI